MELYVKEVIDSAIKAVWKKDIQKDYNDKFLLKEDTLKNSFYYHLRMRLGERFLIDNNIRIYTEFKFLEERIDLVVVEVDPNKTSLVQLSDCVKKIISVIEMKYKSKEVSEFCFDKDIIKIMKYKDVMDNETMFYTAFLREKSFKPEEVTHWLPDEDVEKAKGRVTELYSYINSELNDMEWLIKVH
ncbi:hypothetical protein [Bacillus sp. ISL-57]|uniref:hypothetical protein n=1 Tax=Bacillus sp. ISL-57 TaxID=2819135 RepID=UPI001BE640D3|nr:hypothetical protein [Bacillus sp. ISL-57]MBT2717564.1 hypothetical protein [Bacillus sp. ISL-57]